jgi:CPA2 family monovalent cation:H+ antiporter-2
MTHIPLIDDLALLAAVAVVISLLLRRLRLPSVSGLLVAGVVLGPHGLGLVGEAEAIEVLAEVGVVLLLFSVGLEFSLKKLRAIWRLVFIGGALQVVGTVAVVAAAATWGFDVAPSHGIVYGFVFALSSTAIVLRLLTDRRELDAPHGRVAVGALILQDLLVVPMVLMVPILATGESGLEVVGRVGWALGKAALVVVGVMLVARYLVPRILEAVDASRSRDLFLLAILGICVGTAWLTAQVGLSLALGAFLGGIVVADTEFGHRATGDVLPLRDAFVSVFFVSLGMLLDVEVVAREPLAVLGLFAAFVFGKGAVATLAVMLMRFPPRVAWLAGVGLAQFGEFGFVVLRIAQQNDAISDDEVSLLLAAGVLSMLVTPLLSMMAPHVTAGQHLLRPVARLLRAQTLEDEPEVEARLRDHVVVVGYGVAGRLVADALEACGAPHVVLELNAETVRAARGEGKLVFYGDADSTEVLEHARIEDASALVVTIADPRATPRIVAAARALRPELPVLARVRYLEDVVALRGQGAGEMAVEEVEVGVELVMRVLRRLGVPRNVVATRVDEARERSMQSERRAVHSAPSLAESDPRRRVRVDSVLLGEDAPAVGRTLVDLELRQRTSAVAVALVRDGEVRQDGLSEARLRVGDVLYVAGSPGAIERAVELLAGDGVA